ncbi:MAG: hypothetical protein ACHQ6T_03595 [Myxococcota bacterium]
MIDWLDGKGAPSSDSQSVELQRRNSVGEGSRMTGREIAIEFTEMFDGFDVKDINTMLAKNVSMDMLEFFASYADRFADDCEKKGLDLDDMRPRLPNLLIIGYIIRVLEERLT